MRAQERCLHGFEAVDVLEQSLGDQLQEIKAEHRILKTEFSELAVADGEQLPVFHARERLCASRDV